MRVIDGYTIIVFALMLVLGNGCNQVRSSEDLKAFIRNPENGLSKEHKIDPVVVRVSFRPTDLLIEQSMDKNDSRGRLDSLKTGFSEYLYFDMNIAANEREIEAYKLNGTQFGVRVQTLSFGLKDYITGFTKQRDTIPLADYVYQRSFGTSASSDFLLVFEKQKILESQTFTIQMSDFGLGIGEQKFKFNVDDLINVPKLDFK